MLSPKVKRNIIRIIRFGLIWFVSGIVFFIVEKAAIGDSDYAFKAIRINFEIFIFGSLANTYVGLFLGTIEVLYLDKFFAMKEDLRKRADWYNKDFGLLPAFKAGLHFGKVTTGEIGALKKEIIFTGDVLNTTARIQGLCNHHKVDRDGP